ncbi:hypothetical protein LC593_31440 [Nostoc sp. CHAB 5844]|nr:hypothetical protein [Nostoc sp. CHAB 5844]
MQKIQQILIDQGITFSEDEILAAAQALGMDINDLNDAEVQAVVEQVVQSKQPGILVSTNGKSKNSQSKITKGSRRKPLPPLESAIAHASGVSNQEIQSLNEILEQGIDLYTDDQADRLLASVRNAPKEVVRKFTQRAMEEEADVNSFRDIGQQLVAGIFGVNLTNATE